MAPEEEYVAPHVPKILIQSQVPCLKGVDTSGFDKLPYHVHENCKTLHTKTNPEDEKEFAKDHNIISLQLGKQVHISKVMDTKLQFNTWR